MRESETEMGGDLEKISKRSRKDLEKICRYGMVAVVEGGGGKRHSASLDDPTTQCIINYARRMRVCSMLLPHHCVKVQGKIGAAPSARSAREQSAPDRC